MAGIEDVVARLRVDEEFRHLLVTDPKSALAPFTLGIADLDRLAHEIDEHPRHPVGRAELFAALLGRGRP